MIAKQIRHIGFPVGDIEEAKKFYREFGFAELAYGWEKWDGKWLRISKMWLPNGGGCIELVQGNWEPHVSIEVEEFPMGVKLSKTRTKGDLTVCFARDPSGNMVEFLFQTKFRLALDEPEKCGV